MISGARQGKPGGLLRLLAGVLQPRLDAFVLPGVDVARADGLDLEAAGLDVVATPRHAMVLLIVGELPMGFAGPAAVVYAQMPRPRAVIALGAGTLTQLPSPAVVAAADQRGLESAVEQLRRRLHEGMWSAEVEPFEAEAVVPRRRKRKKKPPPEEPKVAEPEQESGGNDAGHSQMAHGPKGHGDVKPGSMNHGGMKHGDMKHGDMGGGMEMGFMSMVRLTEHLPRSEDGLPMERVQAPFGPFFPGLPSGLDSTMWLDGDTVARVEVANGVASRGIERDLTTGVNELPHMLGRLDPLAPYCYRILGIKALESATLRESEGEVVLGRLGSLELERAASHLNWLASFGYLLGYIWLARRAAHWQLELRGSQNAVSVAKLEPKITAFLGRVSRTPLLSRRLRGVGRLGGDELEGVSGPVARASGLERDARLGDRLYRALGFQAVVRREGDAMARLLVRLEEIRQSLALIRLAGQLETAAIRSAVAVPTSHRASGSSPWGEASVESPRGTAGLVLRIDGARVAEAKLETPSRASVKLIERVVVGLELADALTAIASLDISPWEADR